MGHQKKSRRERWNRDDIQSLKGTPGKPDPNKPGTFIPIRINVNLDDDVDAQEFRPARDEEGRRRTYFKKKDFEKHGYSEGCEGCRRLKAGNMAQRGHTETCRERVEGLLAADEEPRWKRARDRRNEKQEDGAKERLEAGGNPAQGQVPGSSGDHEKADDEVVENITVQEEARQAEAASAEKKQRRRLREADDENTFDQKKRQVQRDKNKRAEDQEQSVEKKRKEADKQGMKRKGEDAEILEHRSKNEDEQRSTRKRKMRQRPGILEVRKGCKL